MKIARSLVASVALCALVGVGCMPPQSTPDASPDAAANGDASSNADGAAMACTPPALTNECSMEGCNFADLTLPYCDGSGPFNFYRNDFCSNQLTLVVISAGWCVPCQQEAAQMQDEIISTYRGRVRVVTVYGQNTAGTAASPNECMQWKNRYSLDSHMVYDATGMTQRYFPNMAYPANMIIDRQGVIRYRHYGTSAGLQSIKDELDALLQ